MNPNAGVGGSNFLGTDYFDQTFNVVAPDLSGGIDPGSFSVVPKSASAPAAASPGLSGASAGALGGFASMLGAKGGAGTGGTFTSLGMMTGNPIGIGIGLALDLGFSSHGANKAKSKAKKAAKKYWAQAQEELGQLQKRQAYARSDVLARQGASGAVLQTGSVADTRRFGNASTILNYQQTQQHEQNIEYNRTYQDFRAQYKAIKKSGGKGGLF